MRSGLIMVMLAAACGGSSRSEEHTSELQSRRDLVCRLLLEKKNLMDMCARSLDIGCGYLALDGFIFLDRYCAAASCGRLYGGDFLLAAQINLDVPSARHSCG